MENLSIRSLKEGYEKKLFSPVEITKMYLERIHLFQDLNAYITITENLALQQAEIAEKKYVANEAVGTLEGIPLSYKDNLNTKGIRTTSGSKIDENNIPKKDAGVVRILQREGAIHLGKVNMHEFAFGITSNNPFYGPVKNPWNNEYSPGGSSGGSGAAVAASLSVASIGTDTAGSIRIPAASCGVIGLKPTHGLVDASGVKHISWTLDHIGPLTKNIDDLAIMIEAMTGINYSTRLTEDIRGLRIGVPKNYFNEGIDESTATFYKKALKDFESLGAILIEIDIPYSLEDLALSFAIGLSEAGFVHEESILSELDSYGLDVKASLENSHSIPAIDYIKALKRKDQLTSQFERLFETVDVIATPTTPITPQKIGEEIVEINGIQDSVFNTMIRLPAVFNLTSQPALSIPCGAAENGLPVGLQLAAARFNERVLIRAGFSYEQAFLQSFYEKRNRISELAIEKK
ncbi:amidase [Bacillus sp. FJAT-49732]|uniref:Amidase n=1 Tax=Lederbergia citrisecunda TaxID=2833583 RepID=A0A942YKI1_9BACI|nr:amidase [Lederbergia citrisecunda]MBS4199294.1 amidase [Lederbergia citrisecunda]